MKHLVIVESPTKAKTIRKFLSDDYIVEACVGHIRDLPQSGSQIPAEFANSPWRTYGVDVDNDFAPVYVVNPDKTKLIRDLKEKLKLCDSLILATDEDREGESIAWHLLEVLKPSVPVKRMVFHEITKQAITEALKNTRQIDANLVEAQETRRVLDRLVGYTLSPVLWKKIAFGLSAGRVQSAALQMIVDREYERMNFRTAEYWDLQATFSHNAQQFDARLTEYNQMKIPSGKDFDEKTGKLQNPAKFIVITEQEAQKACANLRNTEWRVESIEQKAFSSKPPVPFITSTLQQEGSKRLGVTAKEVMGLAQGLYQEGLITYMRTDSPQLSDEATNAARAAVESAFGKKYLSDHPRKFESKKKSAQEAHEAIRPAGLEFTHPDNTGLTGEKLKLYTLIWQRTLACQMAEAQKQSTTIRIEAQGLDKAAAVFTCTGTQITFEGFLKLYAANDTNEGAVIPNLTKGALLPSPALTPARHDTKPPARFTDASIVQEMEDSGIGRPSTYASVINTLTSRAYMVRNRNTLVPTFTGLAVAKLMNEHFHDLVDPEFTSKMEDSLDKIAESQLDRSKYLTDFYLGENGLHALSIRKAKEIDGRTSKEVILPHIGPGMPIVIGKFGPFLSLNTEPPIKVSIQNSLAPADLTQEKLEESIKIKSDEHKSIGNDPATALPIFIRVGQYGPYVSRGEKDSAGDNYKAASIPAGVSPTSVTLAAALKFLSIPRELGLHPVDNEPIVARTGPRGPYIKWGKESRSLKDGDDIYEINMGRALELLAEEKKGSRRGPKLVRLIGQHPKDGQPIQVLDGKYGLYVKWNAVNATLPKTVKAEDVTMDVALELLQAKKGKPAKEPRTKRAAPKTAQKPKDLPKAAPTKTKAEPSTESQRKVV